MKRLTSFFAALLCAVSSFSTQFLVELGTSGAMTWGTIPPVSGTIVNLNTLGKTLNEWHNGVTFSQGDIVWIVAGTYVLNGPINIQRTSTYSTNKSYSVYGGFSGTETTIAERAKGTNLWDFTNETILDGGNTYQVVNSAALSNGGYYDATNGRIWLYDGLSLKNGKAANGGGMNAGGAITIQNCKFINNTATTSGGGFYGAGQFVKVDGCYFGSNTALTSGGGAYVGGDRTYGVYNSTFEFNTLTSTGGGSGGGLYFTDGAGTAGFDGIIKNCIIRGNSGKWFGGGLAAQTQRIENCIIVNNAGLRTGTNYDNTIVITTRGDFVNCTIANNFGGMRLSGSTLKFINTIYWNNHNPFETTPTSATFTNCAFYPAIPSGSWVNAASINNITPSSTNAEGIKFILPTTFANIPSDNTQKAELLASNWKLINGSQCINAGIATNAPPTDYWGTSRPQGSAYDIGAFEFSGYFRSSQTGSWDNVATWQFSMDNSTWAGAILAPTLSAASVAIQNGHTVSIVTNINSPALTIKSGGKLTLGSGYTFSSESISVESDATGTGTVVDGNTKGRIFVSGTTSVQQYLSAARNWYISSPVSAAIVPVSGYTFYMRDEPHSLWPTMNANDPLNAGTGYIATPTSGTPTINFTGGTLNNSNVSVNVSRTQGITYEGFNLIGNPYPSHITMTYNALNDADLLNSIWYRTASYDNQNSKYVYAFNTYLINQDGSSVSSPDETTGIIPPMQAFWVQLKSVGTGSLTFTNAMRSHQTSNPLKTKSVGSVATPLLRVQVSNSSSKTDETVVYFNANASDSYDNYDAVKMSNSNPSIPEIYTLEQSHELVINGLKSFDSEKELNLGFRTGKAGIFSLKAKEILNFEQKGIILLRDKLLNKDIDLTKGEGYEFYSDSTETSNRFSLIFKLSVSEISSIMDEDNIKTRINSTGLYIETSGIAYVELFDCLGKKVFYSEIENQLNYEKKLIPGIYLLNILHNGNRIIRKYIIK